jgi:murein DD-endopeptidase / murein LD-carboxypeptidase
MLKRLLTLFLLLFVTVSFAAGKPKKKKKRIKKTHPIDSIYSFYAKYNLSPDSAGDTYLYYKVYEWIGTNYRYAGNTKNGIDCSGFAAEMYKHVYCRELLGSAASIWTTTEKISKSELKEGDLVFFKIKKGRISHIGVYLGNNKFAHASTKLGVIISDLDEAYYKKYYFSGGRLKQTAEL